ncbi:hypothetical protein KKA57_03885 [Patescibacteria group bacterium]|nr:hypothetical protein [Patescibacteria group bacterium]
MPELEQVDKQTGFVEADDSDLEVTAADFPYDNNIFIVEEDTLTPALNEKIIYDEKDESKIVSVPEFMENDIFEKDEPLVMALDFSKVYEKEKETEITYYGLNIDPCADEEFKDNRVYVDETDPAADTNTFASGTQIARDQGKTIVCIGSGVYTAYGTVYEGLNVIGSGYNTRLTGIVWIPPEEDFGGGHSEDLGDLRMQNNTIMQNLAIGSAPLDIDVTNYNEPKTALLFNLVYNLNETHKITIRNLDSFDFRDSEIRLKSGLPYDPAIDQFPMIEAVENFGQITLDGLNFIPFNSSVVQENVALFTSERDGNVTINNTYSNYPFIFNSPNGQVVVEKNIFENDSYPKPLLTLGDGTIFDHNTVYIGEVTIQASANKGIIDNTGNAPNATVSNSIFSVGQNGPNAGLKAINFPASGNPTVAYHNNLTYNVNNCCGDANPAVSYGNISGDPNFVDINAMNFYLQAGSPAIGSDQNGHNMGAYSEPMPFSNAFVAAEAPQTNAIPNQQPPAQLKTP